MKKINNMDNLLVFGNVILFLAGLGLMFNEFLSTYFLKCITLLILGIVLYGFSFIFKKILKLDISFKMANILGSASFVIAYIMAGWNNLFGSWFSIDGGGVQLFLASICLLMILLSILTSILFKNYQFISITFMAFIVMILHLLVFFKIDYQISLIIIGSILLLISLYKKNKYINECSYLAIYLYLLLSMLFGFEDNFLLSSIILGIDSICLINILNRYKTIEVELFSSLVYFMLLGVFLFECGTYINSSLISVITLFAICLFELAGNTFKLYKNKFTSIVLKIGLLIFLILILDEVKYSLVSGAVCVIFMIITSIVNSYIIKNDEIEKYILPIKLVLLVSSIYSLVSTVVILNDIYINIFVSIIFAIIYNRLGNRGEKWVYFVINILYILNILMADFETIHFILVSIVLFINSLLINDKDNIIPSRIMYSFITFVYFVLLGFSNISMIPVVIMLLLISILCYLCRSDKYKFIISIIVLYFIINKMISMVFVSADMCLMLSSIIYFVLVGIFSEFIFTKIRDKNIFVSSMAVLNLLYLLGDSPTFMISIYSLAISLVLVLVSLKNDNYKALYYVGLTFGCLNLLSLIRFLDGLPVSIYLIIIALILIIIVSIMVYKYQHREIKEVKVVNEVNKVETKKTEVKENNKVKDIINYCPECGTKVGKDENFCGNCGTKIK